VALAPGDSVGPGQSKTFTWTVTAPSSPGTYNFQWRMVQEFVQWFGATTPNVAVTVTSGGGGSGLVGSWSLNEGSGTFAADSSGNGNHATLVNGAGWMTGKQGSAASMDGVNDYMSVPSSSSLNSPKGGLTVALWVNKRANYSSYSCLAGRRFGPGWDDLWVLYYNNSGSDEYSFGVLTSSPVFLTGPSSTGDLNT